MLIRLSKEENMLYDHTHYFALIACYRHFQKRYKQSLNQMLQEF